MTSQRYSAAASIATVSYMAGGSSVGLATSLLSGRMQQEPVVQLEGFVVRDARAARAASSACRRPVAWENCRDTSWSQRAFATTIYSSRKIGPVELVETKTPVDAKRRNASASDR